jgi:hypothetical protein
MLNESNVLLVRHAEKPVRGRGLAPMGEARAQAYATYFPRLPIHGLDAEPQAQYHYLFAAADTHSSHRPRLTLEPLHAATGLPILQPYADKEFAGLADHLLDSEKYAGKNIVICWHHGEILQLANALLGTETPPSDWPSPPWPGDVFGWLLWLRYDEHEKVTSPPSGCYR